MGWLSDNGMELTALRADADAGRQVAERTTGETR